MPDFMLSEKQISTGLLQFILPFSYDSSNQQSLDTFLQSHSFSLYNLDDVQNETAYYGQYPVSHHEITAFFQPMTTNILFPDSFHAKGFQRFSKALNRTAQLSTKQVTLPFHIHSADAILCPFELGFLTIRTEIGNVLLSHAIEFAKCFSSLMPQNQISISHEGKTYTKATDFMNALLPGLERFLTNNTAGDPHSQQMFVHSLLFMEKGEVVDLVNVFRIGTLSGLNDSGKPYVSANNKMYIDAFLKKHSYNRWAPITYYVVEEACFSGITAQQQPGIGKLASHFYGPMYYSLLIHLFHRSMLLRIANEYAALNLDQDQKEIKHLVYKINSYLANFYYVVHPADSVGREIFELLKKNLSIVELYQNTNEILSSLIKYEEHAATKRDTLLLLILTLYTVICGIFSMNLFTHDLEGNIKWSHFKSYNPFEYFAVFIVFSGMLTVMFLLIQNLYQGWRNRKVHKMLLKETVLSGKKQ